MQLKDRVTGWDTNNKYGGPKDQDPAPEEVVLGGEVGCDEEEDAESWNHMHDAEAKLGSQKGGLEEEEVVDSRNE